MENSCSASKGVHMVCEEPAALQICKSALLGLSQNLDSCSIFAKKFQSFGRSSRHKQQIQMTGKATSFIHSHKFAAAIPGNTVVEQVLTSGVSSFLNLYNTVLIGRIILTWFPRTPSSIVAPLATVTDPYLNIFRGIIPPLGGTLDLSPILAFVALDFFSNAAAALPCELESQHRAQQRDIRFQLLSPSRVLLAFRRAASKKRQFHQQAQTTESRY